jgi:hypothetical protein
MNPVEQFSAIALAGRPMADAPKPPLTRQARLQQAIDAAPNASLLRLCTLALGFLPDELTAASNAAAGRRMLKMNPTSADLETELAYERIAALTKLAAARAEEFAPGLRARYQRQFHDEAAWLAVLAGRDASTVPSVEGTEVDMRMIPVPARAAVAWLKLNGAPDALLPSIGTDENKERMVFRGPAEHGAGVYEIK